VVTGTSAAAGQQTIAIQAFKFNPTPLPTKTGKVTVVILDDNVFHSVTADDKSFDSGRMPSGEFRRRFDQPGEIAYHCEVHRTMKGTVAVSG
jgi:plastocyanin